mgnify:CR=1 FL=1
MWRTSRLWRSSGARGGTRTPAGGEGGGLENTALRVADVKEVELEPNHRSPLPLLYCLASIKARPVVQNSHNWCYILSSQDITLRAAIELRISEIAPNSE